MATLVFILVGSCAVCLALTPLARHMARRLGLVDWPDGGRKAHGKPIPVAGGIAILLAGSAVLTAAILIPGPASDRLAAREHSLWGLLLAALTICAVGVADDFGRLRGRHKLLGQVLAALIVIKFGMVVRTIHIFDWQVELGILAIPFTVCWLVGAVNSLNLIDGMDGMLASVGLIVSLALAGMAALQGHPATACVAVALAGALLGFLRYNFPPASIFLGDSGSMLIGLVIGVLAIQASLKGPATVALAAPAALLTIPFFDTAAAILRRKLTGRSIYATDRGHLHHCLLRRGFSNRRVLLWVSFCCLITVAGALTSLALENELLAVLSALTVVGILVVSQLFGHIELALLFKRLVELGTSFLHWRARGGTTQSEVRLQGSADWTDLWSVLISCASRHNVKMVQLNVNAPALNEHYHARWDCPHDSEETGLWRADLPLKVQGHTLGRVELIGQLDQEPVWKKIAAVVQLVEEFENGASDLLQTNGRPTAVMALASHKMHKVREVTAAP